MERESAVHLMAIRKALANGNAAVMVGAGFSRNAEGGDRLRTWPQLGEELWAALNPGVSMNGFSASLVTQLGEQYARVFSPPALEDLLKRLVPDDRVVPGALHEQLLRLPWCEIFTTNYDTLIERAAEKIFDRAHLTVCCREDIPQSKVLGRRRIVKLHGSFPSQRPFIFTEEDYRTYPERFAPFVNLVRQSLLENVFCLIGFSGDDPNFLHWIGWVRDMLDKHTLPIYLFVSKPPSMGELKLLEARHVVPVVLPTPAGCNPDDFGGRYRELFRLLKVPLASADTQWGSIPIPHEFRNYEQDEDKKLQRVFDVFPLLTAHRNRYPGWMVAPQAVRHRLELSIDSLPFALDDPWLIERLELQPAVIALIFFAQHLWQEDVLLRPLEDNCGRLSFRILHQTAGLQLAQLPSEVRTMLEHLGVSSQRALERYWLDLALGLLRWSRQALDESTFGEIATLISVNAKDSSAADEVHYESILFRLYRGERSDARRLLTNWKLQAADPYLLVRKGALQAELGDTEAGLDACLDAIQILRHSQKIDPNSALLLSQEAWACLIANYIRRSTRLSGYSPDSEDEDDPKSVESLGRRLTDLAAKGFDVRRELEGAISALNAEALPPSSPRFRSGKFELGSTSSVQRLGWPHELKLKIHAAFAWLALTERVGLGPRIGDVSFDADAYTQAAWWVQYADSTQRMLSIVVRTLNESVLKPKDDSIPNHKTGWLSRFQVARMELGLMTDLAERSLMQAQLALSNNLSTTEIQRVCAFHIEVFSRAVLRIDDAEKVVSFAQRIIAAHTDTRLRSMDRLWGIYSQALTRCFEALPVPAQLLLLPAVAELPLVPKVSQDTFFFSQWLQLFQLSRWLPLGAASELQSPLFNRIVDELIKQLRNRDTSTTPDSIVQAIWQRLLWFDQLGLVTETMRVEMSALLWRDTKDWPVIPGFYPEATSRLPAPEGVIPEVNFRRWILGKELKPFGSSSSMIIQSSVSGRSWGLPANNGFLRAWRVSLQEGIWPKEAVQAGLRIIRNWWEGEASELKHDLPRLNDLRESLEQRLHLIDEILAMLLVPSETDTDTDSMWQWVRQWIVETADVGAKFWRFRLREAEISGDLRAIRTIEEELVEAFLYPADAQQLYQARDVACFWIESCDGNEATRPQLLIDVWLSTVSTRRIPGLSVSLDLLARTVRMREVWLSDVPIAMIKFGLHALLAELDYQKRPTGSGIPDDEVPLLRFSCAALAFALERRHLMEAESISQAWLVAAENDPLPELRLQRYRFEDK